MAIEKLLDDMVITVGKAIAVVQWKKSLQWIIYSREVRELCFITDFVPWRYYG